MTTINGTNKTQSPATTDASTGSAPAANADDDLLMPEAREMMASGDIGQMIAALLVKMSKSQRDTAREMKEASMKQEEAAQSAKLQAMRDQADAKLTAGMISGCATIGSGALQMSGGIAEGKKEMAILNASSKGVEGFGKIGETLYKGAADRAAQDETRADFAAKQAGRGVEAAKDNDKDARETARKAIDLLKEWQGAKDSASKAALFRA